MAAVMVTSLRANRSLGKEGRTVRKVLDSTRDKVRGNRQ
jgi:hypothetical protein